MSFVNLKLKLIIHFFLIVLGTSSSSFNSIPIEKSDITIISSEEEDEQPPIIAKSETKKPLSNTINADYTMILWFIYKE
jgi:hypothetical protein